MFKTTFNKRIKNYIFLNCIITTTNYQQKSLKNDLHYEIVINDKKLVFLSLIKQTMIETTTTKQSAKQENDTKVTTKISNSTLDTTTEASSTNTTTIVVIICIALAVASVILFVVVKYCKNNDEKNWGNLFMTKLHKKHIFNEFNLKHMHFLKVLVKLYTLFNN